MNSTTAFDVLQGSCRQRIVDQLATYEYEPIATSDLVVDCLARDDAPADPDDMEVVQNFYELFMEDKLPALEEAGAVELEDGGKSVSRGPEFGEVFEMLQVARGEM